MTKASSIGAVGGSVAIAAEMSTAAQHSLISSHITEI